MIRPSTPSVHLSRLEEVFRPGSPGSWVHPEWERRFPWLAQGTTGCGPEEGRGALDFGVFRDPPAPGGWDAWNCLVESVGFESVVHSRQVHGSRVLTHGRDPERHGDGIPGPESARKIGWGSGLEARGRLVLGPDADGHVTSSPGLLLGVTVADCVPVFLVDPVRRGAGLLHAGWRGTAAGVLEEGMRAMKDAFGAPPEDLLIHLGPAICGECYEVGPEVFRGLGLPVPSHPTPLDLRGVLATRARAQGVEMGRITASTWCTLCSGSLFFSHRGGDGGRQVGYLGIRPERTEDPVQARGAEGPEQALGAEGPEQAQEAG